MIRAVLSAGRFAASSVALILVATYYLLASIPFSYYHFLQFPHFWWLPILILLHPLVLAAALAAILPRPRAVPAPARLWVRYVAVAGAATTACMATIEVAPILLSYEVAAALVFAPLLLLTAAAAVHVATARTEVMPVSSNVVAAVGTGALGGLLISAAYIAAGAERGATATLGPITFAVGAAISVAAHVVCFVVGALVIAAVRHASRRSRGGATFERFVVAACATVAGAVVIRRSLLTALSLGDLRAAIIAVALAVAIVGAVWAAAARAPRAAGQLNPWPRSALLLVALIILVSVLPPMLLLADWGGSLQKILTLLAWSVSVAFVANVRRCGRGRPAVVATLCAVSLTTASAAAIPPRDVPSTHGEPRRLDLSVVIDSYATFDPSLGILMDVFRPALADRKFFAALGDRDDVINNTSLGSVPLRLADDPIPAVRNPPNIFVIVVDSLRPDYLSPYNAAATFTPAIADFASSSVVLRQAITPYAGTGLSEPAIWAGGLIQRAMYVHPFSAVNNLQRLLTAGGYRQYVSVDQILSLVLEGASPVTHLEPLLRQPDRLDQTARFDLCDTIPALIERLERDRSGAPVFVYTQPQNVHIRVLAPDSYIPKNDWVRMNGSSFFGPAVAAVSRVDRCFGRLIDFLKSSGMYDDSIVVLTSDHGDGYGEGGRWGHAFYLAPETVRIPLIVHVPAALMIGRAFNVRDTSQLTDLTPTLYDLLGIAPAKDSPLTGRSLFPRGGDAVTTGGAAPILVQSSYSPVFGLFDPSGRWMYVADIPHAREQLYELTVDPANAVSVPSARRPQLRKWLFDRMDQLDRFYSRPNRE